MRLVSSRRRLALTALCLKLSSARRTFEWPSWTAANIHGDRDDAGEGFGFTCDNFLGMSPQDNSWKSDFSTFMIENRLLPQFERAHHKFSEKYGTSNEDAFALQSMGAQVLERARDVLAGVGDAKPSLLHGGERNSVHSSRSMNRRLTCASYCQTRPCMGYMTCPIVGLDQLHGNESHTPS